MGFPRSLAPKSPTYPLPVNNFFFGTTTDFEAPQTTNNIPRKITFVVPPYQYELSKKTTWGPFCGQPSVCFTAEGRTSFATPRTPGYSTTIDATILETKTLSQKNMKMMQITTPPNPTKITRFLREAHVLGYSDASGAAYGTVVYITVSQKRWYPPQPSSLAENLVSHQLRSSPFLAELSACLLLAQLVEKVSPSLQVPLC
ncbi:hypothetical protein TNIN_238461 [Trichonephila inaurata madagascariensis]|uniref:Uncharacterized protein n=1 Tax=Trichonephila inaurata madagascariensis TaxID=2747483 RepID=A0A8X6Y2G9_9ARAC|nr:hypothetical protein TNIN_238461 [Trichonephila inaurata madagascariensis]